MEDAGAEMIRDLPGHPALERSYGTGRKIGVGFNHPLVLDGRMQYDRHRAWDFARRLARFRRGGGVRWMRRASGLPDSAVCAYRWLTGERTPRRK